jgi:hypothetical protein
VFEEEKTITLRKPITLGSGDGAITYTELALREPTAGEIATSQVGARNDTDITLNLASLVAKVPRKAVDQLCQRDLRTVAGFFGQDLDDGEPTNGAS